jgi:hypothetical protein
MPQSVSRGGVCKRLLTGWAITSMLLLLPGLVSADTAEEVTSVIKERSAYSNENLKEAPDTVSKDGSLQFWSSGGLMQWVPADGPLDEYDFQSITPKHIKVITLVEGQAAVAMYYSEGGFQRKGAKPVTGYLTRVTEVYVKEDGVWKVRAAHWSPIAGGSGTNQNSLE